MTGRGRYPSAMRRRPRSKALAVMAGVVVASTAVVVGIWAFPGTRVSLRGGPRYRVSRIRDTLALSCPRPANCFALVGPGVTHQGDGPGTLAFTADDGRHWSVRSLPPVFQFGASRLVCPTLEHCIVTADVPSQSTSAVVPATAFGVTWDAGATWTEVSPQGTTYVLSALSCGDEVHCVATGFVGQPAVTPPSNASAYFGLTLVYMSTGDGGLHWRAVKSNLPFTAPYSESDCPSSTTCWIVETPSGYEDYVPTQTILVRTTDGGRSWQTVTARVPGLPASSGIDCLGDSFCIVGGGWQQAVIATTRDAGAGWRTVTNLPRTNAPGASNECPKGQLCSRVTPIEGVYCVTSRHCWATATVNFWTMPSSPHPRAATELLKSRDGGASWAIASILSHDDEHVAIGRSSCWASACMSTGFNGSTQIITLSS